MSLNAIAKSIGLTDSDENFAVVVYGRRISLDALEEIEATPAKLAAIVETVHKWAHKASLPLSYVHMGTTANWEEDGDAPITEGADAIVGAVLRVAVYPGSPLQLTRAELESFAPQLPEGLWQELETQFGLSATDPGLYLAPAGWSVASLHGADVEFSDEGEPVSGDQALLQTTAEDFPPGVVIDPASLPERVQLSAHYA